MLSMERQLLKKLQQATQDVQFGKRGATKFDIYYLFIMKGEVMNIILDAEEPMNKEKIYYKKAEEHIDMIESFVKTRLAEQWKEESEYLYDQYFSVLPKSHKERILKKTEENKRS